MRLTSRSVPRTLAAALALAFSYACSSSTNAPADASAGHDGAAGHDAATAGAGGGTADGAAGSDAADAAGDGSVLDGTATDGAATDGATTDGATDGIPADAISPDVLPTDSALSMTLTSTAFSEAAPFAAANTCAGANASPPLTWTAGPAGTMSYAVVLTDLSIDAVHWVIWDIPAATTSLPAALAGDSTLATPAGAKQVHKLEFFGAGGAYRGPCPSGKTHVYQLEVDAIPSATLAGVTTTSTTEAVKAAVQAASLAHGDLDGTSNATAPPADAGGQ